MSWICSCDKTTSGIKTCMNSYLWNCDSFLLYHFMDSSSRCLSPKSLSIFTAVVRLSPDNFLPVVLICKWSYSITFLNDWDLSVDGSPTIKIVKFPLRCVPFWPFFIFINKLEQYSSLYIIVSIDEEATLMTKTSKQSFLYANFLKFAIWSGFFHYEWF